MAKTIIYIISISVEMRAIYSAYYLLECVYTALFIYSIYKFLSNILDIKLMHLGHSNSICKREWLQFMALTRASIADY